MLEHIPDEVTEILSHLPEEMKDPRIIGIGALSAIVAMSRLASREEKQSKEENGVLAWIHWHMTHHAGKKMAQSASSSPTAAPTEGEKTPDEDDKLLETHTLLNRTRDLVLLRDMYQLQRVSPSVNVDRVRTLVSDTYTDERDVFVCCLCLSFWYSLCRLEAHKPMLTPRTIYDQYMAASGIKNATLHSTIRLVVAPLMGTLNIKRATTTQRVSNMLVGAFKKYTANYWVENAPVPNPLFEFFRDEFFTPVDTSRCEVTPLAVQAATTSIKNYDDPNVVNGIKDELQVALSK